MKIIKTANGKSKVRMSKEEWKTIGKKAGWNPNGVLSQEESKAMFLPQIMKNGKEYQKFATVLARKGKEGEAIETHTSDGLETKNTAKSDSYIVKNGTGAQEEYIIEAPKFEKRYRLIKMQQDGWGLYQATGECKGILYKGKDFKFIASWGEEMVCKNGDMIVTTLPLSKDGEVYRIAIKEFKETYKLKE
jgi:hypothetical protein